MRKPQPQPAARSRQPDRLALQGHEDPAGRPDQRLLTVRELPERHGVLLRHEDPADPSIPEILGGLDYLLRHGDLTGP